jgi:hypothetical protein
MVLTVNSSESKSGTCSCCGDHTRQGQRLSYEGSNCCVTCFLELVTGTLPALGRADSDTSCEGVMRSDFLYHGDLSCCGD